MDDIDRIVARDYEPSDQDVVKARLRTVGVQEYHLTVPRCKYSTFDAGAGPCFDHYQPKGTMTGSYTMSVVRGDP